MELAGAKTAIQKAHCALGFVTRKYDPVKKGRVVSQIPRAGRHFPRGSSVDLVVSRGRRPK